MKTKTDELVKQIMSLSRKKCEQDLEDAIWPIIQEQQEQVDRLTKHVKALDNEFNVDSEFTDTGLSYTRRKDEPPVPQPEHFKIDQRIRIKKLKRPMFKEIIVGMKGVIVGIHPEYLTSIQVKIENPPDHITGDLFGDAKNWIAFQPDEIEVLEESASRDGKSAPRLIEDGPNPFYDKRLDHKNFTSVERRMRKAYQDRMACEEKTAPNVPKTKENDKE